jgi:DNA-binding CsgD family transcriptional regulator
MIYIKITVIFFCFLLNSFQSIASEDSQLSFYKCTDKKVDIQDINSQFFTEMPSSSSFGIRNGDYWFRLTVNLSNIHGPAIIYIPTHGINKIDLYELHNGEVKYLAKSGNLIEKENLDFNYKYPAFKIGTNEIDKTYFLKVNFHKEANFPLKVLSEEQFKKENSYALIYSGLFYGIAFVVILLHLFFFVKFKEAHYLYYLIFLSACLFNVLLFDGTLLFLLRPFTDHIPFELITHIIQVVFILAFSIHFLNLKKQIPAFVKFSYSLPMAMVLAYCAYYLTGNFTIITVTDSLAALSMFSLWAIAIYYWKKGSCTECYIVGFLILMVKVVYYFVGFGFGLWAVSGEEIMMKVGSGIDMLIFSYAIVCRMKQNADLALIKVNSLESKIHILKLETVKKDSYFLLLKENKYTNEPLTLKEIEVCKLINKGLTNPEIAKELFVSLSTVKTHVSNIFQKFNIKKRIELKTILSQYFFCILLKISIVSIWC